VNPADELFPGPVLPALADNINSGILTDIVPSEKDSLPASSLKIPDSDFPIKLSPDDIFTDETTPVDNENIDKLSSADDINSGIAYTVPKLPVTVNNSPTNVFPPNCCPPAISLLTTIARRHKKTHPRTRQVLRHRLLEDSDQNQFSSIIHPSSPTFPCFLLRTPSSLFQPTTPLT